MNMADRIKQRMQELDINQDDLAQSVGLTQPAIYKLLSGKTKRTTRLTEIARKLGVRSEWLVEGSEPKYPGVDTVDQAFICAYNTLPPEQKHAIRTLVFSGRQMQSQSSYVYEPPGDYEK